MTSKLYHIIIDWLHDLIEGTPWEGHVFAVGGCCRDEILGNEINDLDLAVDLPNGGVRFARWLQKKRQVTGKPVFYLRFGTAKLRLRRFPHDEIELVQTRREQYTKETSRCPEVAFGTIEEDCYRRDFTVNSLYYDITRRRMADITGRGLTDMENGVLRTPMDPDETFHDDPVRILRGLRFANRFGWTIEPEVFDAMMRQIDRIEIVSRERCHSELCKMLNGPRPVEMMQTLRQTGVLEVMIPELKGLCKSQMHWNEAMQRLQLLIDNNADAPTRMRLAAIFMSIDGDASLAAKTTRKIMTGLRFNRPIVSDVAFLVLFAGVTLKQIANRRYVRAMQNIAAIEERFDLLTGFLHALRRDEASVALRKASQELVDEGSSGFNGTGDNPAPSHAPRKRRHRGGRGRRRDGRKRRRQSSSRGGAEA